MNKAAAWSVRGVGRETREIAEEAARRAGMSLGDWLDEVVSEQAADQGISAEDWDEEGKLDAIGDRLSRLSRNERPRPANRRDAVVEARAPLPQPNSSQEDDRRAQDLLEAAIAKFETRAAKTEERTAKALETVASWIEQSQSDRAQERATLQSVSQKLTAIEQREVREPERAPAPAARAPREEAEEEEEIDRRLSALARRVAAPERSRGEFRRRGERPRIDVRDSVAQIARRQSELDSRETGAPRIEPARTDSRISDRERAPASARSSGSGNGPVVGSQPVAAASVAPSVEKLRAEIAALSSRVERLRADEPERPVPPTDAEALRAGLASMSRSLADIAPRDASPGLEGAVGELGDRLDAARRAGASDRIVAPLESMLAEIRQTLREHDPRAATHALEREIRALGGKVEALAHTSVGPEVFERLRGQTEDVRNLLADVASRIPPAERLERQISELAHRIERLATSPTPHADSARVIEMLAETRSQIERSTPLAALDSIERRLEQLAMRMDEALRRSPASDPRPIEDLARRIDGVRAFVERQSDQRPTAAKMDAALAEISAKLDRLPAAGADSKAVAATLRDLTSRLDDAFRRSSSSAHFDPKPIEDLAWRIESVRATLERQGDFRPHAAKLEAALGEISAKLDRLPAAGADAKGVAATLQDLTARLDDAFQRSSLVPNFDPRPIEDLARRIESVRATMERQGDFRPHAARLEAALGDISAKLDSLPASGAEAKAAAGTLQDLTARLEQAFQRSSSSSNFDPKPIEDLARRIDAVRSTVERQADFRPHAAKLEAALGDISSKLDRSPAVPADMKALTSTLQELAARLDEVFRRSAASASFDPRPIEDLARRIEAVRASVERQGESRPQTANLEAALRDIHAKLDRPVESGDTRAMLAGLQEQMTRLEEAFRRPAPPSALDPRPIEELGRRIESVRTTVERQGDFRPHAAKLEAALGEINSKLDRAPSTGADMRGLASTLQEMAARLDEAFQRSASSANFDPRPIEDLARRIEAVRATMERQGDFRPHAAKLEAALREIQSKLDRPADGGDAKAMLAGLQDQIARLEEAFRRPAPSSAFDPRPIEDLARRIESVRTTVERQADFRPHAAKLEAALGEINTKLDRAPAAGVDMKGLTSTLQELAARLEEVFRRTASSANFDPRPIEDLARRIEAVRATMERQGDFRPHAAKLEVALREIHSKLDRPVDGGDTKAMLVGLQDQIARLEEALRRPAPTDPKPIEDLARRIEHVRATVERQTDFRPHAAKLEAALDTISSKLDRPAAASLDSTALTSTLQDLTARLDEAFRQPQPAPRFDPRPLEELARRIDGVRASVERQADFAPQAAKLEAALSDINSKLDRQPATASDSSALTSTLNALTARLDEAFRRPPAPASIDPEPLADLGRRIEGVRAAIERATAFLPDAESLDSALAGISAKIERQAFTPDDLHALTGALQDLAARVDQAGAPVVDTAPIESLLRSFGERPVEVDIAPIEAMLRDLGEKFAASTVDAGSIERMLGRVDAKLDAVARLPMDVLPLERAVRDLQQKLDFRDPPKIDAGVIEQAAEMLAKRLDMRGGAGVDTDALINQISEIHGRLDSLGSAAESNLALERTVAELLEELEATRQSMQSSATASQTSAPVNADLADLRAEQANSDRRMQARLADVQDILEKLVNRLGRIEEEVARADEGESQPRSSGPAYAARPARSDASEAALRNIPDRAPRPATRAAATSRDEADFLIEPGGSPASRLSDARGDPAAPERNLGINAHIAAARRAAQAALQESASRAEESSAARPKAAARVGSRVSPLKQAQEFIAARPRPVLLGLAFFVAVTGLAVVELRGGHRPAVQRSELPAPAQSADPVAAAPKAGTGAKAGAALDYDPVGALTPPHASAYRPAPADLVAAIPADAGAKLREAASAGDSGAETELGLRYLEGRTSPRDPKLAARWLEQAAVQGLPVAQYRLAALYEKGVGVTRDVPLARSWYLKAANAGNSRAMHNLAVVDAEDAGSGKPDYAEAARWFRRAGELGIRDSQFNLGVLYGRGLGVPQDLGQSWLWFSLAARQGDADAAKKRDEVAAKLDPKSLADVTKALADFKTLTPDPSANEAPAPAGGWDAKPETSQASRPPSAGPAGTMSGPGSHG